MKKLLLLLITIITFSNVCYSSFPVSEVTKSKVEVSQPNPVMDENSKILLLTLASLIGVFLGFSMIAVSAYWLGGSVVAISLLSLIWSFYLNFKTPIFIWDWRNYLSAIIALLFLIPIVFVIGMATTA
tara:strand:+ start:117 stop:500 length:384 start_codon:yes stop_codon:yes gene_type:complete